MVTFDVQVCSLSILKVFSTTSAAANVGECHFIHSTDHLCIVIFPFLDICVNIACIVITAWLKAFQRRHNIVQLNRSTRE